MEQAIRRQFTESPRDFRPVPWWAWTGAMTTEGVDRQLLAMREQGIYEFFIFAVYGLDVEFNSDAYFDLVEYTLRRCREWGLKAWIYDEFNWPSGICGGKVLRDHPWTRAQELAYKLAAVAPGEAVTIAVPGELLSAAFIGSSGGARELELAAISDAGAGCQVSWTNDSWEAGQLLVFSLSRYEDLLPSGCGATWTWNQAGFLDELDAEAVQVFIDYCYEPYASRFPEHLGREIPGFFTDEPGLYPQSQESFPFTRRLWATFAERYGYRLEPHLPELVLEIGAWQTTRHDYWRLVSELFAQNYIGQIERWCQSHGVQFTGHFVAEEKLRWDVRYSGAIHYAARAMGVPGIDFLRDYTSYDQPPDGSWYGADLRILNTTAKRIASVADYGGAVRRMVEAYGVVDWDQSLQRMKRVVDWLAAMGLNLINDNTLIYSLAGFRKRRVSGKNFSTPWFPYYGGFSEYVGRVCWMTTVGRPVDEVGVLYPSSAGWTLYGGMQPGSLESGAWSQMEEALAETGDALNRLQRGWKFIFDEELAAAAVSSDPTGGRLTVGDLAFRTVILPAVPAIAPAVCQKLMEFAQIGGRVLVVGQQPFLATGGAGDIGPAVAELLAQVTVSRLPAPEWGAAYVRWLDAQVPAADFVFTGSGRRQILASERADDERRYLFISNQGEQSAAISVWSAGTGVWELWDPDSGRQWAAPTKLAGDGRCWTATLAPMQALYLVTGGSALRPAWQTPTLAPELVVERRLLTGPWRFERLDPNLLVLDCAFWPDPDQKGLMEQRQGGGGAGWAPVPLGRSDVELDPARLPCFWLKAEFDAAYVPADLELVLDSRDYGEAYLNGILMQGGHAVSVWDEGNWAYPLAERIFRGRTTIVLRCRPSKYYAAAVAGSVIDPHELEPLLVRGSFAVGEVAGGRPLLVPETGELRPGAWEAQGYRDFCGSAVYRQTIELPNAVARCWLWLEDARQVAAVSVNGQPAGVRCWAPYAFDLSGLLRPGPNELAIQVTNNFGRAIRNSYFGPITHEVLSGLTGRAWLVGMQGQLTS